MKNLILLISALFIMMAASVTFSQVSNKPVGDVRTQVTSEPTTDPQVSEVIRNLKLARKNNDSQTKTYWETKLHELTNPQIINNFPDPFIGKAENKIVSGNDKVLNVTTLTSGTVYASSVSQERVNGDIYAALGFYGGSSTSSDTLKLYRSTDNGIHFTMIYSLTSVTLFKIPFNQIDVEAVSRGDSSYAFMAISYNLGGYGNSAIIRIRQDGGAYSIVGYSGDPVNRYTNGRITSDNASYTTNSYVYFSTVLDSLGGGLHNFRSKLGRIENPFAAVMSLTAGYQSNPLGLYGYGTLPAPDSAAFQTDLAFVNTAGDTDQVYTCSIVYGMNGSFNNASLYFTRSNNYGATAPALFNVSDGTFAKYNVRIAATGYSNNSLMVVTRRLYSGFDFDPYYFYSPLVNSTTPSFSNNGYVDNSTDTTYGISVAAKYRGNGSYLFAYGNAFHGFLTENIYIKGFNNNVFGTTVQSNPPGTFGTIFGPDASFRNVNNDSCLVSWGGGLGIGSYITGGCTGSFVGIGNNSTEIKDFRLYQNYPNPFNPTTNISYNIPASGLVKIVVYDILGAEVSTIVNENKTAGYYSATFDGKNLASGAYYYKITFTSAESRSFTETRKMMLLK